MAIRFNSWLLAGVLSGAVLFALSVVLLSAGPLAEKKLRTVEGCFSSIQIVTGTGTATLNEMECEEAQNYEGAFVQSATSAPAEPCEGQDHFCCATLELTDDPNCPHIQVNGQWGRHKVLEVSCRE